jgi:hypothetical protein
VVSDCASLSVKDGVDALACNNEPGVATNGVAVGIMPSRITPEDDMVSFRKITSLLPGAGRQGAVEGGLPPR